MLDLVSIRKNLEGPLEDARFAAWMELYTSPDEEACHELEKIAQGKDPVLKLYFIRFLACVPEHRAVSFLCRLIDDENQVVGEAARKGFEKNQYDQKAPLLLPLIQSPQAVSPQAVSRMFAMEKLALGQVRDAVKPLLDMLSTASDEVLLRILAALRHLPAPSLFSPLSRYLSDPREEVRVRVLYVYGSLCQEGYRRARKILLAATADFSPRVRGAAVWSLARLGRRKNISLFKDLSVSDPDPSVREECLFGLSFFYTPPVVAHLLDLLTREKERSLILRIQGLLSSIPYRSMLVCLEKCLKSRNEALKNRALLLYAEYDPHSRHYFSFLTRALAQAANDRAKLPVIEALGAFENPRGRFLLEPLLTAGPVVGYAAMNAIMRIWLAHPEFSPFPYLADARLSAVLKQIVLRQIVRKGSLGPSRHEGQEILLAFLSEENLNLRYLAAQVLAFATEQKVVASVFDMVLKEKDATSKKFLVDTFFGILKKHKNFLGNLFEACRSRDDAVALLFSLAENLSLERADYRELFLSLLAPDSDILTRGLASRVACLIRQGLQKGALVLDDLLDYVSVPAIEKVGQLLLEEADLLPSRLPVNFKAIGPLFERAEHRARPFLLHIAALSGHEEGLRFLARLICRDELKPLRPHVALSLNYLVKCVGA